MMENWMNLPANEFKALRFAEEYGIVEYEVIGTYIKWEQKWFDGQEWHNVTKAYDLFTDEYKNTK